jgi:hypothetical protein
LHAQKTEKGLLTIGGLVGLAGGLASLLLSFFLQAFLPGGNITEPSFENITASHQANMVKFLSQFHQIYGAVSEMLVLSLVLLTAIPLFLALHASLRETSPGYALIGGVFGVLWAMCLLVFLVERYESLSVSAFLYGTAGPASQATVVAAAEATYFTTYGLFYVGGILGLIGFVATGVAMLETAPFGRKYGLVAVAFGLVFGIGTIDIVIGAASNPQAMNPFFFIFPFLFWGWTIAIGQKLYRLSRIM